MAQVKVLAHTPAGKLEVGTIGLVAGMRTNRGYIGNTLGGPASHVLINGKYYDHSDLTVSLTTARRFGFERTGFAVVNGRVR